MPSTSKRWQNRELGVSATHAYVRHSTDSSGSYRQQLGHSTTCRSQQGHRRLTGKPCRLQERSLALDNAQTIRARYRKAQELLAILESYQEPEPVKAEALRELETVSQFQRQQSQRCRHESCALG